MSRYAIVPHSWLSKLPAEGVRTLALIATYANSRTACCWPSNAELARALDRNERSIKRDIRAAVEAGLISIVGFDGHKRTIRIECPDWNAIAKRQNPTEPEGEPFVLKGQICHPSQDKSVTPARTNLSPQDTGVPAEGTELSLPGRQNCHPSQDKSVTAQYRTFPENIPNEQSPSPPPLTEESKPVALAGDGNRAGGWADRSLTIALELIESAGMDPGNHRLKLSVVNLVEAGHKPDALRQALARAREYELGNEIRDYFRFLSGWITRGGTNGHVNTVSEPKKPSKLIGAEAGLAMARRALAKGEADQAEVDRYEAKVAEIKREAGIT